jgi:hypothetical protein
VTGRSGWSCENDPVDGFAQRDRGRQFVIGDLDHRIHQPGLNCPVRQLLRVGQRALNLDISACPRSPGTAARSRILLDVTTLTGFIISGKM